LEKVLWNIGSVHKVSNHLGNAKRKITLPSQTWTLRDPEAKVSAPDSRTEKAGIEKGYSQGEIASEVGVSPITVNHWLTGHSLMAQCESIERLRTFLAGH